MKPDLHSRLGSLREQAGPWLGRLRAGRFWIECALVTGFAGATAYLLGSSALDRASALQREAEHLERTRSGLMRWAREAQQPTPAESLLWEASRSSLRLLDAQASEPLVVARMVAQRAEEVGVRDVRIHLASPDSTGAPSAARMGKWTLESGHHAFRVEFSGGIRDVISFLGALPPQVEVAELSSVEREGRLVSTAVLLTRRARTE